MCNRGSERGSGLKCKVIQVARNKGVLREFLEADSLVGSSVIGFGRQVVGFPKTRVTVGVVNRSFVIRPDRNDGFFGSDPL